MKYTFKNLWNLYGDKFGETIFHPQFIAFSLRRICLEEAKKYAKGRLVDVGCGRMTYRSEFIPLVDEYVGVDHPNLIKFYKYGIAPDVLADVSSLPFPDKSFNTALSFQVLEYIENPQKMFNEIARVLKPGGTLILSAPFLYAIHDAPYDRARYTRVAIEEFLENAGLEKVKITYLGGFFEFWFLSLLTFLMFLMKRVLDLSYGKKKISTILYLFTLIIITIPLILSLNLLIIPIRNLAHLLKSQENYFPEKILVVAQKRRKIY